MLTALSREIDPGDFRQTLEKIALYKLGDAAPLTPEEVSLCAPGSTEADLDDVLNIVAEGRIGEIGPVMARLEAQGTAAVTLLIMATRHFRALHTAASDPGGVGQGIGQALHERVSYSEEGQLLSASFMDYGLPRADDLPSFTLSSREVPCTTNPLGAKGCGEAGCAGSLPAVMNALVDALRPVGVTHINMPATPEVIWRAIHPEG